MPVGQEAAYLAMSKADKLGYNPFIRAATGSDSAAVVRNGYVFDAPVYRDRFNIGVGANAPTHILDGLGTNDLLENGSAGVAQIADGIGIMYPSLRAAWPSAKIGKWLPSLPRTANSDERWTTFQAPAIEASIAAVAALNDPLAVMLNHHALVDPNIGWPLALGTPTAIGTTTAAVSDEIHPLGAGREALALQSALWIALTA